MNSKRKISVVMSVFGYKKYIGATINSILSQTMDDFEFIIIDDGCKYDLLDIIEKFRDNRIRYIKNVKNIGLTDSLIKGIQQSTGKYIVRMDAGNISLKNRLRTQYDFLEKNTRIHLVGSSIELIDKDDRSICEKMAIVDPDIVEEKMMSYNCIDHSTIMFRRADRIIYRKKFKCSQDYDFYLNLLSDNYVLANISEVLLKERLLSSSITYFRRNEQEYYRSLASKFYGQRRKSGIDDYDLMEEYNQSDKNHKEISSGDGSLFLKKQKIYYFLYSGKLKKSRSLILEILKTGFSPKLIAYLIMSYLPFLVRILGARRGIKYGSAG